MTHDEIWQALKVSLFEIFPEYVNKEIHPENSLRDLGANSVDRAEILMLTLARLKLQLPLIALAGAENMQGLVDILYGVAKEKID